MEWFRIIFIYLSFLFFTPLKSQSDFAFTNESLNLAIQNYYTNIDSSIYYFHKCRQETHAVNWLEYISCTNALATAYWEKHEISKSYQLAIEAFENAKNHLQTDGIAYSSALNNLGFYSHKRKDYDKAIDVYLEALDIDSKKGNYEETIAILNNLGDLYLEKGDWSESIRYFNKSLNLSQKFLTNKTKSISNTFIQLAKTYSKSGEMDTSIILLNKALDIIPALKKKGQNLIAKQNEQVHYALAEIYLVQNNDDAFIHHINEAIDNSKIAYNKNLERSYLLYGDWYLNQNAFDKAKYHYNLSLKILKQKWAKFELHPEISNAHYRLSQCALKENKTQESLYLINLALNHNYISLDSPDYRTSSIPLDKHSIEMLNFKAQVLMETYLTTRNDRFLNEASYVYNIIIQLLNQLRQSYFESHSKELLVEDGFNYMEEALDCYYHKYEANPTKELFDTLFQIAENSKSMLLLESINEITAKGHSNIPDSLIEKEQTIKLNINFMERELRKSDNLEKEEKDILQANLFETQKEHRALIQLYEDNYPKYFNLKYNLNKADSEDVRNKLKGTNAALIEYFVGKNHIYIFYIDNSVEKALRLKKWSGFDHDVNKLRQVISEFPQPKKANEDFMTFTETSNTLYKNLIKPLQINKDINKLIIIRDDQLSFIPFEILLTDKPQDQKLDYSLINLDYLLEKFEISYSYSASILKNQSRRQLSKTESFKNQFLGFGPEFSNLNKGHAFRQTCNSNYLAPLACNAEEVDYISNLISGASFVGKGASLENFKSNYKTSRILHFATHSCLSDENPMENKIFLSDGYISNYNLYNLNLNSELAVLSACQTGDGELRKGEGIMSLTRGFVHAGCPSILMTLWSVEDCSTSLIMNSYYDFLLEGKSKDESLKLAKIKHIEEGNKLLRHPFFWASFIQFGDIEPISFKNSNSWKKYIYGLVLVGLFLICLLYFKARK